MTFPNKAGDHADTDDILRAELKAAGIPTFQEAAGEDQDYMADTLRRMSGEVETSVVGVLHGWEFKRAWRYWIAKGPGIEVEAAERLHAAHGRSVRVDGHCGCPSPGEWFHGLACDRYHVDDAAGLKALADTIRGLVERQERRQQQERGEHPAPCANACEATAFGIELRRLRLLLKEALPHVAASAEASHLTDGFRKKPDNELDKLSARIAAAALADTSLANPPKEPE